LLTPATALTRSLPLCHALRLLRSPVLISATVYSSPESAVMKTIATSTSCAADDC
jgi:hypothetical protein